MNRTRSLLQVLSPRPDAVSRCRLCRGRKTGVPRQIPSESNWNWQISAHARRPGFDRRYVEVKGTIWPVQNISLKVILYILNQLRIKNNTMWQNLNQEYTTGWHPQQILFPHIKNYPCKPDCPTLPIWSGLSRFCLKIPIGIGEIQISTRVAEYLTLMSQKTEETARNIK